MSSNKKSMASTFVLVFIAFYLGMEFALEGVYEFLGNVITIIFVIYMIGAFVQWRQKRKAKKQARRDRAAKLLSEVVLALMEPSRPSTPRPARSGMGRTLADVAEATGTRATVPAVPLPSQSSGDTSNHARCLARSIGEGKPCNNLLCKDCWPAPVEESYQDRPLDPNEP